MDDLRWNESYCADGRTLKILMKYDIDEVTNEEVIVADRESKMIYRTILGLLKVLIFA